VVCYWRGHACPCMEVGDDDKQLVGEMSGEIEDAVSKIVETVESLNTAAGGSAVVRLGVHSEEQS